MCVGWLLLLCVPSFSNYHKSTGLWEGHLSGLFQRWLLWQIIKVKDGFKSDNVLYIIRGLHQDHMFLIKDMSTCFLEKSSHDLYYRWVIMLRMIFWSIATYSSTYHDSEWWNIFHTATVIANIHILNKNPKAIQWHWYHSQFSRACESTRAAKVARNTSKKGKTTSVWFQLLTKAQPVLAV